MKEIERALIAELLFTDITKQVEAVSQLTAEDFDDPVTREIFIACAGILRHGKQIDLVSLSLLLPKRMVELSEISQGQISDAKISGYVATLKEKSFKSKLIGEIETALVKIKESNFHDEQIEIKEDLSAKITKMELFNAAEFIDIENNITKIISRLDSGQKDEGYSWGINKINLMTSGIVIPRYYIIGGLKKSGKTRFLINTMKVLHRQNVKIGFISLEMPQYELSKMLCSSFLNMNDLKLRSGGFISNFEKDQLRLLKKQIGYDLFKIDCTPSLKKEQVVQRIKVMAKLGCKVILLDYIQRIIHDIKKEAQEIEQISAAIADATREFNVAIIALAQLSNLAERETPSIGHLKGSGGIGETADTIMLIDNLFRRTKKDEHRGKFDIYFEQRYGDSGIETIQGDLGSSCFGDDNLPASILVQENIF